MHNPRTLPATDGGGTPRRGSAVAVHMIIGRSAAEATGAPAPTLRALSRVVSARWLRPRYAPGTISAVITPRLKLAATRRVNNKGIQGAPLCRAGASRPRVPCPRCPQRWERGAGASLGGVAPNSWGRTYGHGLEGVHA